MHPYALAALFPLLLALASSETDFDSDDPFRNVLETCAEANGTRTFQTSAVERLLLGYSGNMGCQPEEPDCQSCFRWFIESVSNGGRSMYRHDLESAAVKLLYLTLNQSRACKDGINVSTSDSGLAELYYAAGNDSFSRTRGLLTSLQEVYKIKSQNSSNEAKFKCFSAKILASRMPQEKSANHTEQIAAMASYILVYSSKGYSINEDCQLLPLAGDLEADLLGLLNASAERFPLQELLSKLGIGSPSTSGGGHDHDHDHDQNHEGYSNHGSSDLTKETSWLWISDVLQHATNHSGLPSSSHIHEHDHDMSHQCLSANQLLSIYQVSDHSDEHIPYDSLKLMYPALLQQVLGGYCKMSGSGASTTEAPLARKPTDAEAYGYGTLAVLAVGVMPLLGIAILPCLRLKSSEFVLTLFVALGAGAMLGDALLHLIPSILGDHNHRHEEHSSEESSQEVMIPDSMWKMLVICLVIYLFFVGETAMHIVRRKKHPHEYVHREGHGHTHMYPPDGSGTTPAKSVNSQGPQSESNEKDINAEDQGSQFDMGITTAVSTDRIIENGKSSNESDPVCSITPLALALMAGDAMHNLADGLMIGAAFATRLTLGLTTTIAVVSHEVPHKLANIAVLLSSGYKRRKVFGLSFMSMCAAIVGFYCGAVLGQNETVASYIFAGTVATFLYVCLLDLLPEIMHKRTDSPWLSFAVMNLGLLTGFTFMLLFAIYEGQIDLD